MTAERIGDFDQADIKSAWPFSSGAGCRRFLFAAAAERELTDRALDVEFQSRHFRKQLDIVGSDGASTQPQGGRGQIQRLKNHTDILEDERVGDRAVLP
jgi:hypothetical protein